LTAYNVFYDHKFALELAYVQAPVQILNLLYIVHKHGSYIAGLQQLLLWVQRTRFFVVFAWGVQAVWVAYSLLLPSQLRGAVTYKLLESFFPAGSQHTAATTMLRSV
jgi:hypothetical protein